MKKHLHNLYHAFRNSPLWGVFLFMVITLAFHILWRLGKDWFTALDAYVALSEILVSHVFQIAAGINDYLFGDLVVGFEQSCTFRITGRADGTTSTYHMLIDESCSGLKQFYQALFLFLIYPGPARHKLWYIPLAIFIMHIVNVLRIVALSVTMLYAYQHWDFVHDWVVRPLFYVVLFGLWVIWEERFAALTKPRR
jgi:exosortase/archaeosortase family protein